MILIDYNSIAVSGVLALRDIVLDENTIRHVILNSIRVYRVKHRAKYGEVVICAEGRNNWRKTVFPNYKHKRKDDRKDSKIDWNDLFRITNMVLEEIQDNFPYKVIIHDNCEADDVIAALCEDTQEFGRYQPVLIVSSDKDFFQLQKYKNVDQYSPRLKKFVKEDGPRQQLVELVLKGDTSDGIPNILSPDNTFVDGIRQKPLTKKIIDRIMETGEMEDDVKQNFKRNKKLIDLSETPKVFKAEIIYNYEHQDKTGYARKVMPYLIEKRCRQLLESVEDFI